jgi:hypothetical protein
VLFPLEGGGITLSSDNGELLLPPHAFNRLVRFYNAAGGDPKYASDLWLRMFYFSAIVITTLGFGDITPVSTTARCWVAGEAILGVIVIGFFLYAVGARLASSRRQD